MNVGLVILGFAILVPLVGRIILFLIDNITVVIRKIAPVLMIGFIIALFLFSNGGDDAQTLSSEVNRGTYKILTALDYFIDSWNCLIKIFHNGSLEIAGDLRAMADDFVNRTRSTNARSRKSVDIFIRDLLDTDELPSEKIRREAREAQESEAKRIRAEIAAYEQRLKDIRAEAEREAETADIKAVREMMKPKMSDEDVDRIARQVAEQMKAQQAA